MFKLVSRGNFKRTEKFLKKSMGTDYMSVLAEYGQIGVDALSKATPKRTGKTAASWSYNIEQTGGTISVVWTNSNTNKGENIALLIQYGHGTGWHTYVQGRDYINPALQPIFDALADKAWKEVTSI